MVEKIFVPDSDTNSLIVPIHMVDFDAFQNPRFARDPEEDRRLQASIEARALAGQHPLIQPVICGPKGSIANRPKDSYPLLAGFGRVAACLRLGHKTIQIILDSGEPLDVNAAENLMRQNLHSAEICSIVGRYLEARVSEAEISKRMRLSVSSTRNYARVYQSPIFANWKSTVADAQTRDFALPLRDMIEQVGKLAEEVKTKVKLAEEQEYEPTEGMSKADNAALIAETRASEKRVAEAITSQKFQNRILEQTRRKKEKIEEAANRPAGEKRGGSSSGASKPSKFSLNSERMNLQLLEKHLKSLGKAGEHTLNDVVVSLWAVKWAAGDVATPPSKKLFASELAAARQADVPKKEKE